MNSAIYVLIAMLILILIFVLIYILVIKRHKKPANIVTSTPFAQIIPTSPTTPFSSIIPTAQSTPFTPIPGSNLVTCDKVVNITGKKIPSYYLSNMPIPKASINDCGVACQQTSGCNWFTFSQPNNCYLSNGNPVTTRISGFKIPTNPDQICPTYSRILNTDVNGYDILSSGISLPDEKTCQSYCTANPICDFYSYGSNTCYLKQASTDLESTLGVIIQNPLTT